MTDFRQAWMGWKAATRVLLWSALLGALDAVTVRHHAARELAVVNAKTVRELEGAGFHVFRYDLRSDDWIDTRGRSLADWQSLDWTPAHLYGFDLRCVRSDALSGLDWRPA